MGLRADEAAERRKQTGIENERRDRTLAEASAERTRNNEIQDDDRAVQAFTLGLEDQRYALGALHEQYKNAPGGIPDTEAQPIYSQIKDIHGKRQAILDKRSRPILEKAQQEARDFSSRMAAGTADPMSLPAGKFGEYILASTGIPVKRFVNGEVGAAISDAQAGLETQNYDLVFKAANVLLPEIKQGIGTIAPDGSVIVDKELVGFAPAPVDPAAPPPAPTIQNLSGMLATITQPPADSPVPAGAGDGAAPSPDPMAPAPLQPGTDPDKLVPVLKVTTRQPDGRLTSYPAPVTVGRSSDPNAPIAPPVSMKALVDRLGQLTVLNTWMQKPEVKAKADADSKGDKKTTFNEAWGMVHGDLKTLQEGNDPTSKKIAAIRKLQVELGVTFEEAARQFAAKNAPQATGVQGTLNAIKGSGLSDADKAKAERVALKVEAAPKAGKTGSTGSSAALGGAEAPTGSESQTVDFWARAVIAGDRDWQVGLARSKSGSSLIEKVKRRVPELAHEMGLEPQDIGTERAKNAALGKTLVDLTKRAEAVELFANKVEKDMKTFDNLLDKASLGSPLLISKPINALRRQFSDPELAQLDLAAKQVGAEYERLITGGTLSIAQLHVGAAEDAKKLINGDMPPKQARAVMETMRQEMKNAREAAHASQGRVTEQIRGLGRGGTGTGGKGTAFGVGGAEGAGAPAAKPATVQTATNPKTGEKIQLVNGNWVPVK
jgi:hypothetical protein